ncbi:hypothetical protein DFH09DRAFT_1343542 [Mycena vulgaris]|nr:hypothetical protein DFH09DRAFT_1343542 [Mycena vulgaris]
MTSLSVTSYGENGLDVLCRSVVADALHNLAERPPEPCHPGTRNSVLGELHDWFQGDGPPGDLIWLHGSAGAGKSAVAQRFAADCHEQGTLGGSFFFQRGNTHRGTWKLVIPTLAYQLAASYPELRLIIQDAVETDRLVVGQAMRLQFQKLIAAPLAQAPPLTFRPIIVIDGLDECEGHDAQVMLLQLIIEALHRHHLPVRFLIASRPEPHLREALEAADNMCRYLELHPDVSAHADLRRYFCDEFTRIREVHTSRGTTLENDWPCQDAIEYLVGRSSGTFIYASTVLRYVDDEYSHPAERLDSVLRLDPESTAPLDDLYSQILSSFPNRPVLRRVLHAVIRTNGDLDPEEIDSALQLRGGVSRLALRGLHSLLSIPAIRTVGYRHPVTLLHASLEDFLLNPARSSVLCIAVPTLDSAFVRSMIHVLCTVPMPPLLFRSIATSLLHCIIRVPPTHDLLPILRNVDVQQVHYSSATSASQIVAWLEFNDICADILSRNPDLRSVLNVSVVWPPRPTLAPVLYLLGLKWNVLRPLCALRDWFETDLVAGIYSGALGDPLRSVFKRQDILRYTALCCISRIKDILISNDVFEFDHTWLLIVARCEPCDEVLQTLEGVELVLLCERLSRDPEYHAACHDDFLHPACFIGILDWLRVGLKSLAMMTSNNGSTALSLSAATHD